MLARTKMMVSAVAALLLFVVFPVSVFFAQWLTHDLIVYVCEPLSVLVVARWIARWVWHRYQAAPGFRGFIPHKTPWAP
ncbi:MAG: hypothetical protein ACRDQZ_00970 [Mycobacteriales bacterium]